MWFLGLFNGCRYGEANEYISWRGEATVQLRDAEVDTAGEGASLAASNRTGGSQLGAFRALQAHSNNAMNGGVIMRRIGVPRASGVAGTACTLTSLRPPGSPIYTPNVRSQRIRQAVRARAAASSAPIASHAPSSSTKIDFDLACPICHTTPFTVQQQNRRPAGGLHCPRCQRTFAKGPISIDLTLTSGTTPRAYQQRAWGGTELFRSPLVSLAYERGWRQSFAWAGFPGVEREVQLAMDFLLPSYGGMLVDMSCGSGLFSRRFLSSGKFAGVIAADFSESMLDEAARNFSQDASLDPSSYLLLRADVARLPFATGSVAAIHAGAAIHCWPNPQAAMAEISRVLRPGGVFVASTFLSGIAPLGQLLGSDALVRPLKAFETASGPYRWWEEDELRDLCDSVGLQGFQRVRRNRFIMFCVAKPPNSSSI